MQMLCVGRTRGSRAPSTGFTEFEMAYVKRLYTKEESTNAKYSHVSAGLGGCKILTLHFRRHAACEYELVLKTFAQSRNRNWTLAEIRPCWDIVPSGADLARDCVLG